MREKSAAVLAAIVCVLLVGCGGGAKVVTSTTPVTPASLVTHAFGQFDIALPSNWELIAARGDLLIAARSGSATIAVWRYPQSTPRPSDHAQLKLALHALVDATRLRTPSFQLIHTRIAVVSHRSALEIVGTERLGGKLIELRSTHVFFTGAEVVIDSYVAPAMFPSVDQVAFRPVLYSFATSSGT